MRERTWNDLGYAPGAIRGNCCYRSCPSFGLTDERARHWVVAGVVAAVLAVAAAGVGTYVSVQQANAQAEEADAIRKQKEEEAKQARESALYQEQQLRRRQQLLFGKQQAITAAAGVDVTSGTPLYAELDFAQQAEMEALNVRRTGKIEESSRQFEARIAKFRRDTARAAIPFEIAGGVLSAASSATSTYYGYKYGGTGKSQRYSGDF